jgi:hypothetical protein
MVFASFGNLKQIKNKFGIGAARGMTCGVI